MDDFEEYVVFKTTARDGSEIEMAVVDEFEFENKNYVAAALVEGDAINEDGLYIFRAKVENDEFKAEKIHSAVDYKRICDAYSEYIQEKCAGSDADPYAAQG